MAACVMSALMGLTYATAVAPADTVRVDNVPVTESVRPLDDVFRRFIDPRPGALCVHVAHAC
jgi:hypothetical protein